MSGAVPVTVHSVGGAVRQKEGGESRRMPLLLNLSCDLNAPRWTRRRSHRNTHTRVRDGLRSGGFKGPPCLLATPVESGAEVNTDGPSSTSVGQEVTWVTHTQEKKKVNGAFLTTFLF